MDSSKSKVAPCTCVSHDDKSGRMKIEVEMPGVAKDTISLDMRRDGFCVSAPRGDTEYAGCFTLAHEVEPGRTEAKYENGVLSIFAPIKDWDQTSRIEIR